MLMSYCLPPFEGYKSSGPRWSRSKGRFTISLIPLSHGTRINTTYARYLKSVQEKRVLNSLEEVDHIDGDRTHDKIENLQLLTKSENVQKTSSDPLAIARRKKTYWFICPACGTKFYRTKPSKKQLFFCSRPCGYKSRLFKGHEQISGKVERDFTPKNIGEPWVLWSTPIPVSISSTGTRLKPKRFSTCQLCKKPFPYKKRRRFCSDECSRKDRAEKVPNRMVMSQIVNDIRAKKTNWTQVGKSYGVSDNAVRKWAKKYGLL
jgi:predicted RNA-binding Zn-ribbon protein involved in translation (DUF1610 family)